MAETATELLDPPASQELADGDIVSSTPDEVVAEDLLVEEISIDGMCGVY